MKLPVILLAISCLLISSCKKDEVIEKPVNELKPDQQVSLVQKEAYVNRIYISLLGRKPVQSELDSALKTLEPDNASVSRRQIFVSSLIGSDAFYDRLYVASKAEYLNSIEDASITEDRSTLVYARSLYLADSNMLYVQLLDEEIKKIDSLLAIPADLKAGKLDMQHMHIRVANNYIYDQINMGVANFTFSVFESFLFRQPTEAEWDASQKMCNSQKAILFNQQGNNRPDFLNIFFNDYGYYEGQVTAAYLRIFGRTPNSSELYEHTIALITDKDFNKLFSKLLVSDEYFF